MLNIAVLASGGGTNLEAIFKAIEVLPTPPLPPVIEIFWQPRDSSNK